MTACTVAARRGATRGKRRDAMRVLVFNTGSSSLKCGLYETHAGEAKPLLEAQAEGIGKPGRLLVTGANGEELLSESVEFADADAAVVHIKALLDKRLRMQPDAIGHRLVHGGPDLLRHALIDAPVLAQLRAATPFAPLHLPSALAVIDSALCLFPDLPQAACLDTAFHAGLPDETRVLPLPHELRTAGLHRYGFHGLSCESILARLNPVPARLIIAHLGSGASLTAVRAGKSVDTSMGMTPEGGVIMGTRSGDLDPGALIWLARNHKLKPDALEDLVMRRSGLLGISGVSGDMRKLRAAAPGNPDCALAIRMFSLSVAKYVAAQSTTLGGLDMLIFTGGIGEHDQQARADICTLLAWTGIRLDETRNQAGEERISANGAACEVRAMPTQEGAAIARHVWRLTREGAAMGA